MQSYYILAGMNSSAALYSAYGILSNIEMYIKLYTRSR